MLILSSSSKEEESTSSDRKCSTLNVNSALVPVQSNHQLSANFSKFCGIPIMTFKLRYRQVDENSGLYNFIFNIKKHIKIKYI